jgi:hypothetical protein
MKLSEIRENPNNPRIIKDDKFQKLVKSIKEFPEMLEARPIVVNPDNIVLGGNMRLKACKAAGLTEAPVYVASWEESKAKEFIVKDNVGFGEWDWDILANEWDENSLENWGLDFPRFGDLPVMEGARDQTQYDVDGYLDSGIVRFQLLYSDEEAESVRAWFDEMMEKTETKNYSDAIQSLANENDKS